MSAFNDMLAAISGPERARVELVPVRRAWLASRVPNGGNAPVLRGAGSTPTAALARLLAEVEGEKREDRNDAHIEQTLADSIDDVRAKKASAQ